MVGNTDCETGQSCENLVQSTPADLPHIKAPPEPTEFVRGLVKSKAVWMRSERK